MRRTRCRRAKELRSVVRQVAANCFRHSGPRAAPMRSSSITVHALSAPASRVQSIECRWVKAAVGRTKWGRSARYSWLHRCSVRSVMLAHRKHRGEAMLTMRGLQCRCPRCEKVPRAFCCSPAAGQPGSRVPLPSARNTVWLCGETAARWPRSPARQNNLWVCGTLITALFITCLCRLPCLPPAGGSDTGYRRQ
jgi:hypothetical protein